MIFTITADCSAAIYLYLYGTEE